MSKIITFIGHRDVPCHILSQVISTVENLVNEEDEIVFLSGGMGSFDSLCAQAVRKVKKEHPNKVIKLCLVLPSYQYVPKSEERDCTASLYDEVFVCSESDGAHYKSMIGKRNRWMVDQSDVAVSYVNRQFGGAHQTLKYAEKKGITIIKIEERG